MMTFRNIAVGIRKITIRSHNVLFYQNRFWLVGICFQWNGIMSFAIFIFLFTSMAFMNELIFLVFLLWDFKNLTFEVWKFFQNIILKKGNVFCVSLDF
jgi:hypothetical protein